MQISVFCSRLRQLVISIYSLSLCALAYGDSLSEQGRCTEASVFKNLILEGEKKLTQRQLDAARTLASRADQAKECLAFKDRSYSSEYINRLGMLWVNLGEFLRARNRYIQALSSIDTGTPTARQQRATILNNLGQAENGLLEHESARDHLQESVAIRRTLSDSVELATALDNLGAVYSALFELDQAEEAHKEALTILRGRLRAATLSNDERKSILEDLATALGNSGKLQFFRKDYPRARDRLLEALNIHASIHNGYQLNALVDAADLLEVLLEIHDEALFERTYKFLLEADSRTNDGADLNVARLYGNLSRTLYVRERRADLAEPLAIKALALYEKLGRKGENDEQQVREILAYCAAARKDYPAAIERFHGLLSDRLAHGDVDGAIEHSISLANAYRDTGNSRLAADLLLEILFKTSMVGQASEEALSRAFGNLGLAELALNDFENAQNSLFIAYLHTGSSTSNATRAWVRHAQSLYYFKGRDFVKAEAELLGALKLWQQDLPDRHRFILRGKSNLASLKWISGDAEGALGILNSIDTDLQRDIDRTMSVGSESERLRVGKYYKEGLFEIVSLCLMGGKCDGLAGKYAATLTLRRKGAVLDAMLSTNRALARGDSPATLRARVELRQAQEMLVSSHLLNVEHESNWRHADQEAELLKREAELEAALPDGGAGYRINTNPVAWQDVANSLPTESLFVDYLKYQAYRPSSERGKTEWQEYRYAALVLARGLEPIWVDLGTAKEIDDIAAELIDHCRNRVASYRSVHAERLYEMIVAPISKYLPKSTTATRPLLLVSPDGLLNIVPFGLLKPRDGVALGDALIINLVNTGSEIVRDPSTTTIRDVVVFADPDFGLAPDKSRLSSVHAESRTISYEPLVKTRGQADFLAKEFERITTFLGPRATTDNLASVHRPSILHLATHGVLGRPVERGASLKMDVVSVLGETLVIAGAIPPPTVNPMMYSWLAFAGANHPDSNGKAGLMTALQVSGLDLLGTQLVVLSACETANGFAKYDGEFSGLRRALSIAGSESQLTTLWKVDEEATLAFIKLYYSELKAGIGRAAAVRNAQSKLRTSNSKWAHPYFWAAFTPSGQWAPIGQAIDAAK